MESDEGFDANSTGNSLQSDSLHGYSSSFHGYRDAEKSSTRTAALEAEVVRLTRLLDGYRRSSEEQRSVGDVRAGRDTSLLHAAQSDVRRLQSRVNDVETEKLQLERELNKTTNRLRDDVQKLETQLQLEKKGSSRKMSELDVAETSLKRTVNELREQVEFDKDRRECLEKELMDAVDGREQLRQKVSETDQDLLSLREKLDSAEQSNSQLVAQVTFLTKSNESLMEDIDDNNERMSEELKACRQARNCAEQRCTELEAHCNKLTETVQLLAERARELEMSVEEAEKAAAECERLRHEHNVLVASEEKLVDKINDKDDVMRRLVDELTECRSALEEQSHKLQMANIALDTCKEDGSRCARDLEDTRTREKELQESEKQLMTRVRELEKTEAILTTKLSALEADKEQLSRTESELKCQLEDSRRRERELLEKVAVVERREGTLQEKVDRLESRATHLVELLRSTQEMSVHRQLRDVFHDDQQDVDDTDVVVPDSSCQQSLDQTCDVERMTKVELVSKVYQLERKCCQQRNKMRELSVELSTLRQKLADANHTQLDTVLPALMSTVENKVCTRAPQKSSVVYE